MNRIRRRAAYYLLLIAGLVTVGTLTYDLGMRTFEPGPYPPAGTEVSLLHSMQVVVETFTATGYGSDSPWLSPEMNLMVMVLDLTGVGLFFIALPAVFLPLFREALTPSVPTAVDEELSDHVIVCSDASRVEALVDELTSNGVDYVILEPDEERAADQRAEGYEAIHADPESVTDLEAANVSAARALVADDTDRIDASIVLAAREADEDVTVVSVVEDVDRIRYHELAGADHVLTPRQVLGRSLAAKITTSVTTDLGETVEVGEDFEIAELPVRRGSELAGGTLVDGGLREEYGVNVIGAWVEGEFRTPPPPETPLDSGTILLVTGESDRLDAVRSATRTTLRRYGRGETVVVGYGAVGEAAATALDDAEVPYTVVDREDREHVDVVGDATDPETMREAGVGAARSVILALPDDAATEFATLVVRDLAPDVEVLARAEQSRAVRKAYRAGADYALSLATVSGRSIASRVVRNEAILSPDTNVEVIRTTAPGLAGTTLREAEVRERTGCTVVAVERDGDLVTDLDPDERIRRDDELVVAGTDEGTGRFLERFA